MIEGLLTTAIIGLFGWIFNQNKSIGIQEIRTEKLEEELEHLKDKISKDKVENDALRTIALSMDAKIDKRIGEQTSEFKELLHQVHLTLRELNVTVNLMKEEFKELKNRNEHGNRS